MKEYIITRELESKSKYGEPNPQRTWHFAVLDVDTKKLIGKGFLKSTTEMEALDRIREAFPNIGQIEWVSRMKYYSYDT